MRGFDPTGFVAALEAEFGVGSLFVKVGAVLAALADADGFVGEVTDEAIGAAIGGVQARSVALARDVLRRSRFLYDDGLIRAWAAYRVTVPRWAQEAAA